MTGFADAYFTYGWLCYGVPVALLVLGLIFHKPLYTNRKYKFGLGALYFAIFMLLLFLPLYINPIYWGYGGTIDFKAVMADDRSVLLLDYRLEAGDEGSDPVPHYRVRQIDRKSGQQDFRTLLGPDYSFYLLTPKEIVFERYGSELLFVDRSSGAITKEYSKKSLSGLFTEFSQGVDQVQLDMTNEIFSVTSVSGKVYDIVIADHSIHPAENYESRKKYAGKNIHYLQRSTYTDVSADSLHGYFSLKPVKGSDKLRQLHNREDSLVCKEEFLEASFAAQSKSAHVFIIQHFETTEKKKFLLSAVSWNGEGQKWKLPQSSFSEIASAESPKVSISTDSEGKSVFVTVNNYLYEIDAATGKILKSSAF